MRAFLLKNVCIIISLVIACVIFVPFLRFWIGATLPATDLIAAIVAVLIGIISISFPIIIGNTAQRLAAYNNKYIASIFQEEQVYKRMLHIIPMLIGIVIAFFFFSYPKEIVGGVIISRTIAIIAVALCVYSLIVFKKFWTVFSEYSINTDSLVLKKITAKVQALLARQRPSAEYLDYMDIYYQILYTKLKAESYVDLIEVQKRQSDLILGVLNSLPENENNPELNSNQEQLFHKYYLSAYLCWRKSFRENADAARDALEEYYRVLNEILLYRSPDDCHSLFFLYQRIAGDLTVRDTRSIPHCRVASWQWYMNMLSGNTVTMDLLYALNQQILAVMSIIIQNGNQSVFRSFIANTVDGIWFIKEPAPNISDRKLVAIMDDIGHRLPGVFLWAELKEMEKQITENTQDESLRQGLQKYIQGHYKYNHIRLVVIILGAYCLFKKQYDYIEYILHYNQPEKGQTHFLNEDIIPDDINILLKLYAESATFEGIFHYVWEDHNDGQYWFKRFISLITCRLSGKKQVKKHYRHNERDNKQRLEYYKFCIDEMRQQLSDCTIGTICSISEKHLGDAQNALEAFGAEIQKTIDHIKIIQPLSDKKIENFKRTILAQINSNSIWASILTRDLDTDDVITLKRAVGYNTLLEKSFLAEGDTGIYIGFEHTLAETIVYQIDFFIERSLRFRSLDTGAITKSNFKDKIFGLDDSWGVLFFNYYNMIDWLADKSDFQWGRNEAHLVGTTGKGTAIYSVGDPADRSARVFIFKRECISKIIGIDAINIEVMNFTMDEKARERILQETPDWLAQYNTDEEKKKVLQKSVQIKIAGEVAFSTIRDLEVYVFDNI